MTNEVLNKKRREFLGASALVLTGAVLGVSTMTNATAVAADYRQNPFTLVYEGALRKMSRARSIFTRSRTSLTV